MSDFYRTLFRVEAISKRNNQTFLLGLLPGWSTEHRFLIETTDIDLEVLNYVMQEIEITGAARIFVEATLDEDNADDLEFRNLALIRK